VPYFGDGLLVFALLVAVAAVVSAFVRIWHWLRYVFAVTNFRVIHQVGILGSTFEEIPLVQVRDMIVEQSFRQRMFGYGRIRVYSLQSPPRGSEVSSRKSKGSGQQQYRRLRDPPGLEDWWWVPKPYAIEKEIESLTELLVMARASTAPPIPTRP
jgi:hypothetical protein